MSELMQRTLELKVAALIWRSPLAVHDAAGEGERQRLLQHWLAQQGIALDAKERELLEECSAEAQEAALGNSGSAAAAPFAPSAPPTLLHPLSAEPIPPSAVLLTAWREPMRYLEKLPERERDLARWYRALWRALMREPLYQELPAHAILRDHSVAAHRSITAALVGARHAGGKPALLALHVGPVQSFIEAARRTHDLAIGSYTVGYLAFSGAVALAKELGPDVLLNPDVSSRALADKLLFDEAPDKPQLLRAALMNRVLAVVPEVESDRLASLTARAVSDAWREMGRATQRACGIASPELEGAAFENDFDAQLAQHLELDLVVQPWPDDLDKLRTLLEETGTDVPRWLEAETARPSAAFGVLADLTERLLGAHRDAVQPVGVVGDQRPKCTNCGNREQLGTLSESPFEQQRASRRFFVDLSEALQRHKGDRGEDPRASLQLTRGEGLCAVCLTKRLANEAYYGGETSPLGLRWQKPRSNHDRALLRFPSTATFASAPFRAVLARRPESDGSVVEALEGWAKNLAALHRKEHLDFTPPGNLLEGLGELGDSDPLLAQEGTWFYDASYVPLSAWRNHYGSDPDDQARLEALRDPLQAAQRALRDLRQATKASPSEYYGIIILDGDDMGQWKSGRHCHSPRYQDLSNHRDFPSAERSQERRPVHPALYTELSRRLAALNQTLHDTVAGHLGRLVYHGGDDVLAFVPLATALPCLAAIRRVINQPEHLGSKVTISAGLSLSHWKTPLSGALRAAREAEKQVKGAGKNGFGLCLEPRSGQRISLVLPWTVPSSGEPVEVIEQLGKLLQIAPGEEGARLLSGKAAYVLRDELPALACPELRGAFLHRAERLLFGDATVPERVRSLLEHLLSLAGRAQPPTCSLHKDANEDGHRDLPGATTILHLLSALRFLSRQRNGLESAHLLAPPATVAPRETP